MNFTLLLSALNLAIVGLTLWIVLRLYRRLRK